MTRTLLDGLYRLLTAPLSRRRQYRTDNTNYLDEHFDPQAEFARDGTLGKLQWEELGTRVLRETSRQGHFVALPLNSPVLDSSIYIPNRYIDDMVEKNYFVVERVGDIEVVSPSQLMCLKMYLSKR